MITCVVRYTIDPSKIKAFESFAAAWIRLVDFSFPSMAAYEQYRQRFDVDPAFIAADCIRDESGCVLRYERSLMRPFLGADK
jgi:hypothetical protein